MTDTKRTKPPKQEAPVVPTKPSNVEETQSFGCTIKTYIKREEK